MKSCPSCGAEVDAHMKHCWECHEPIGAASSDIGIDDFDDQDDDVDLLGVRSAQGNGHKAAKVIATATDDLEEEANALLAGDEPEVEMEMESEVEFVDESEVPDTAVVAYVAQDEVQAGAISQLLSDCGIKNYATSGSKGKKDDDAGSALQVQVLKEDLASAQQLINDFTAEFDDFS